MRKLRSILLVAFACVLLAAVFHTPILRGLGAYLVRGESPQKADIAVVLAGDEAGNRILSAAELVRAGYTTQALISGPGGHYGFYESDLAIPFAENSGFPESYFISYPNRGRSTREEAEEILPELRRRGVHSVLLVTSNYHTRRAAKIYRALAPDMLFIPVAAPDEYFSPEAWWKNREGRKTFAFEWIKTVADWLGL